MQVQAVQIVARLLGGDGEAGFVDQADQVAGVDGDPARQPFRRHHREIPGREDRQIEFRAAGGDLQPGIVGAEAQFDLRALGQFAHDLVESVGGRRDLSLAVNAARRFVDDLHVQVGGRESHGVAVGGQQHIGQDRDGVAPLHHALHVSQRFQQGRALDR